MPDEESTEQQGSYQLDNHDREEFDDRLLAERAYRRRYFPHLKPGVALRESDDYPHKEGT